MLDLDYPEDSNADADANFVLIEGGKIAEAQATAEGAPYDEEAFLRLLRLAQMGCAQIFQGAGRGNSQMTRRLGSGSLVIATHNAGKLKEISALLEPHGLKCISAGSLGLPEPAETGTTFVQNALIKARAAAEASGLVALADDSGPVGRCARRSSRGLHRGLGRTAVVRG